MSYLPKPILDIDLSTYDYKGDSISCVVRDPTGKSIHAEIIITSGRERQVVFWPTCRGKYMVHIFYDGKSVRHSPFRISVE